MYVHVYMYLLERIICNTAYDANERWVDFVKRNRQKVKFNLTEETFGRNIYINIHLYSLIKIFQILQFCYFKFHIINDFHAILNFQEKTQDQPKCNCRQEDSCPLEGNCLAKELICQCNLKDSTTSDGVNYNSLTENTFKD